MLIPEQYMKTSSIAHDVLHKKLIQISKSTNLQIMESWPMERTVLMEIPSNSSQHSFSLFRPTPRYKKEPRNNSKPPSASLRELAPILAWGKPQNSTKLLINITNCACDD